MSISNVEHRKTLERELRNNGHHKFEISRNGSGHMEIRVPHEGKMLLVCRTSWTPSDYHSTPNARAQMRRALRKAGLLNQEQRPSGKFAKALALPTPGQTISYEERIAELETTVAFLLDAVATLADRSGVDLEPRALAPEAVPTVAPVPVEMLPEERVPPSFPVAKEEPKQRRRGKGPKSRLREMLVHIGYDWTPTKEVVERDGRNYGAVSMNLTGLKKLGVVENKKGQWRKVRPPEPEATEAPLPPKPALPIVPTGSPLLAAMSFAWMTKDEIARASKVTGTRLSAALAYHKKCGLVENGLRGQWRKVRKEVVKEAPKVEVQAPVEPPPSRPVPRTRAPLAPQITLLDHIGFDWTTLQQIEERVGYGGKKLANALQWQKRVGNVERGKQGSWRRRRIHNGANGHHHNGAQAH